MFSLVNVNFISSSPETECDPWIDVILILFGLAETEKESKSVGVNVEVEDGVVVEVEVVVEVGVKTGDRQESLILFLEPES